MAPAALVVVCASVHLRLDLAPSHSAPRTSCFTQLFCSTSRLLPRDAVVRSIFKIVPICSTSLSSPVILPRCLACCRFHFIINEVASGSVVFNSLHKLHVPAYNYDRMGELSGSIAHSLRRPERCFCNQAYPRSSGLKHSVRTECFSPELLGYA